MHPLAMPVGVNAIWPFNRKSKQPAEKRFRLSREEIQTLAYGYGGAIASDRITVDGKPVGYMYRTPAQNAQDSGWAFLAGDEDEAGMVLVDPGFSGQFAPPTPEQRAFEQQKIEAASIDFLDRCAALARARALSEAEPNKCFEVDPALPPDVRAYKLHARTRAAWYEAERSQSDRYFPRGAEKSPNMAQADAVARTWGQMPVVVLTAGIAPRNAWDTDDAWRERAQRWRAGHDRLAARSTKGVSATVPDAHHFIHKDRPEAVFEAIESVVTQVRATHYAKGGY